MGLWDASGGSYSPAGLGRAVTGVVDLDGVLPRGTLMLQCPLLPSSETQVFVDYVAEAPWGSGLRLTMDQTGTLRLLQWAGHRQREVALATGHLGRARQVLISYSWDAPARKGVLSVEIDDTGAHVFCSIEAPLPLSLRDAVRLMADPRSTRYCDGTVFAALADHVAPIGPMPSLSGQTMMATPDGLTPVSALKSGQLLTLADGDTAQVRWIGSAELPARGRFAPVKLHAPFYGAIRDLVCGPEQRLQMSGSDVDYLFATPHVSCQVGHLTEGVHPLLPPPGKTVRYWQVVLDRNVPLRSGGLDIATLDASRVMAMPGLLKRSILSDVPAELLPTVSRTKVQMLRRFETRTYCQLRAA